MSRDPQPPARGLYAGFWRRFAAFVLDCVVVYLLILAAILIGADFLPGPALSVVLVVVAIAYFAAYHASSGQATPGKRALGIKVTDLQGGRIGFGRAIVRAVVTLASLILLGLGFLPAAFTSRRMALDDMAAGTLVVDASSSVDVATDARSGVMPLTAGVWLAMMLPVAAAIGAAYIAISAFRDYEARAVCSGTSAQRPSSCK